MNIVLINKLIYRILILKQCVVKLEVYFDERDLYVP